MPTSGLGGAARAKDRRVGRSQLERLHTRAALRGIRTLRSPGRTPGTPAVDSSRSGRSRSHNRLLLTSGVCPELLLGALASLDNAWPTVGQCSQTRAFDRHSSSDTRAGFGWVIRTDRCLSSRSIWSAGARSDSALMRLFLSPSTDSKTLKSASRYFCREARISAAEFSSLVIKIA
jgi:hypothetical protein